jgi:hypothetical protein
MLGLYENFPQTVHKTALFATSISNRKLQQALIRTFQKINNKTFNLEEIASPSVPQCMVIFEIGIAESNSFNYLDNEEASKILKLIQKNWLQTMDFFCALRYYRIRDEKKTPLKFDYYMMRFAFSQNSMEAQIYHERGPRYASPEDIVNFVTGKANEALSKKILRELKPL